MGKHKKKREKNPNEKHVSLHPLEFEDAVKGLLETKPPKKKRGKNKKNG